MTGTYPGIGKGDWRIGCMVLPAGHQGWGKLARLARRDASPTRLAAVLPPALLRFFLVIYKGLIYGHDLFYFGYSLLEQSFDAHFKCHLGAGTASTGPLQTYPDSVIGINPQQFNVSAVVLEHRPDGVNYLFDLLFEGILFATATVFAHFNSPEK